MTVSAILTHQLTKTYGANRGIRNVDLDVSEGEIFGFLGPNGAGKSTTMRTLLGFMAPTGGSGEVFGRDIVADSVAIRQLTGNLPGEFAMDDRLTGRQMIHLFARLRGVTDLSHMETLASRLDADLDRPTRKLSRGNKQKIAIISALFHRPPLIMLDEPTSGLDPLMQDAFLEILLEARDAGQTVFFSSHNLAEIERVADRVGIIREGEMVAVEIPRELTARAFRHVRFSFARPVEETVLTQLGELPGVQAMNVADHQHVSFQAHDDINAVVRLAARHDLASIDIERPSLEELFLGFYDTSEGAQA